jgi:hypothetical protein
MLPWAHGHQRQAIRDLVPALIAQQTGCQAQLARSFGHQAAATQRLSRLRHPERLAPRHLAEAGLLQALGQRPAPGPVRLALDGPSARPQPLLGGALIVGRRAVPIAWRASDATVRKGRRKRAARAVMRRAGPRVIRQVERRRGRVPAARGVAAVARCPLLTALGVACVRRVPKSPKSGSAGVWRSLDTRRLAGPTRRRPLGHRL